MKKKLLSIVLCVVMITMCIAGCGNNGSGKSDGGDKSGGGLFSKSDYLDMEEFDVVYDFSKVSEDFWDSYEPYGYEGYFTNLGCYESRLESEFGQQYGSLNPPLTKYTAYTVIDGVAYEMVINSGDTPWLRPKQITPIGDGNFDDRIDFYYTTTDLVLHWANMDLIEKGDSYLSTYPELSEDLGYVGNINGWDIITLVEGNGDFGGYMYQNLNDEFFMKMSIGRIKGLSDEQYKTFYTNMANSITLNGVAEGVDFEHVVLPEEFTTIELGYSTVNIKLEDYYLSSWLVSEDYLEYNMLNLVSKDKTYIYKLSEYPEGTTLENETADTDYSYYKDHTCNGMDIRLEYTKSSSIGDIEVVKADKLTGCKFEIDDIVYSVWITSKEEVTVETVENFLYSIFSFDVE